MNFLHQAQDSNEEDFTNPIIEALEKLHYKGKERVRFEKTQHPKHNKGELIDSFVKIELSAKGVVCGHLFDV
ncbi:hypothetical protein ACTXT7_012169 [Hymenolepis weldensis]